jgi:hypothetical protein
MCAGTILALAAALTNFAVLYQWIGSIAQTAAPLLDARAREALPLAGPLLLVLLFGSFAAAGHLWRRERAARGAAGSRSSRSPRSA